MKDSGKEKKKRPKVLEGPTIKSRVGCGRVYGTLNCDNLLRPVEVFMQVGKSGQCARVQTNAACRLVSHGLRYGTPPDVLMRDCLGETCDKWDGSPHMPRSCSDFLGRLLAYGLGYFRLNEDPDVGGDLLPKEGKQMDQEREHARQLLDYLEEQNAVERGLLTEQEQEFIGNVEKALEEQHPISDAQASWLQDIHYKVKGAE